MDRRRGLRLLRVIVHGVIAVVVLVLDPIVVGWLFIPRPLDQALAAAALFAFGLPALFGLKVGLDLLISGWAPEDDELHFSMAYARFRRGRRTNPRAGLSPLVVVLAAAFQLGPACAYLGQVLTFDPPQSTGRVAGGVMVLAAGALLLALGCYAYRRLDRPRPGGQG